MQPVIHVMTPLEMESVKASALYTDGSLDFVFIDAEHKYEFVMMDIISWLPKVKQGGVIAGHDYGWEGVTRAINEVFGQGRYRTKGQCWIVTI
jgi:predicted O-methyltransferase YrrM